MANQWLRLWHDMPNDPKWRTIAKISKQPITSVISVYLHMLVSASANTSKRGVTQCNAEDVASALDIETEAVTSIMQAMQARVLDDDWLTGWEIRQPAREDDSADRVRAYRERQKSVTPCNVTVTQCNAPDKDKEEDKKERKEDDADASSKKKRGSRFTLTELPDDWRKFCEEKRPDLNPQEIFDEFKDFWAGVPGSRGCKLDWLATWRNRVREKKGAAQQQTLSFTAQRDINNKRILDEGMKRYEEENEGVTS